MGPAKLCFFLLRWALIEISGGAIAFHFYHVFLDPVGALRLLPKRWRSVIDIRPLGASAMDLASELNVLAEMHPEAPIDEFRERLAGGDVCLAAYRSQQMVGYVWLRFGTFEETEARCRMAPIPSGSMSWGGNLYIPERERGGIVFAALWDGADALQRSRGCRWTASQISVFNEPSLRVVNSRTTARRVASLFFFCLGPCQLMLATLAPYIHFAVRRSTVPTVAIRAPDSANRNSTAAIV